VIEDFWGSEGERTREDPRTESVCCRENCSYGVQEVAAVVVVVSFSSSFGFSSFAIVPVADPRHIAAIIEHGLRLG
jgi:hypothetical protein